MATEIISDSAKLASHKRVIAEREQTIEALRAENEAARASIDSLAELVVEAEKYCGAWQRSSLVLEKITRLLVDAVELLEGEVEGGTVKCSDVGARIFLQECRDAIGEVYGSAVGQDQ